MGQDCLRLEGALTSAAIAAPVLFKVLKLKLELNEGGLSLLPPFAKPNNYLIRCVQSRALFLELADVFVLLANAHACTQTARFCVLSIILLQKSRALCLIVE